MDGWQPEYAVDGDVLVTGDVQEDFPPIRWQIWFQKHLGTGDRQYYNTLSLDACKRRIAALPVEPDA